MPPGTSKSRWFCRLVKQIKTGISSPRKNFLFILLIILVSPGGAVAVKDTNKKIYFVLTLTKMIIAIQIKMLTMIVTTTAVKR